MGFNPYSCSRSRLGEVWVESIIKRIKKGNFWQFHGGIHPPEQKLLTCNKPIASAQIPSQLIIPVRQHIGQAGDIIVAVGDKVLKGQALSIASNPMQLPIHAPTSGIIKAIELSVIPHPSGMSEPCIVITPDGEDKWRKRNICPQYTLLPKTQIVEKIARAGIAGMGGAGFPAHVKVGGAAKIDYLIINAAECEPYITADDLLIQEHSPTVLDGINILDYILSPKHILIGIEDNKSKAIEALKKATANIDHIHICVIPTKYPSGGEKQLIKILTGKEVPSGVLPSSLGIVMQNVATCFAIADAIINDIPLIKRVITISGQALEKPQNVWTLIGTPVGFLTQNCRYTNKQHKHLIMGGPMMGFSLASDQIPVIKSTNCILAPSEKEITSPYSTGSKEVECIRCGQCADVCPAQLLPQELQWSAKAKDQQQLQSLNLFDCIECGACAYVCPSQIPLVHYYRVAKAEIRQQNVLDIKAEKAKIRFEARKERLERDKIARAEKNLKAAQARKARMNANTSEGKTETSAVAAALARVKAKKAQANAKAQEENPKAQVSEQKNKVATAVAKAKAKKLAKQESLEQKSIEFTTDDVKTTTNKELVENPKTSGKISDKAANIANIETALTTEQLAANDKKAKIAAAVAKAKEKAKEKAKKHTQEKTVTPTQAVLFQENDVKENDVKESGVKKSDTQEVSIQKIKAQKTASKIDVENNRKNVEVSENDATNVDNKKARIAAAVAKAKAKKLATQAAKIAVSTTQTTKQQTPE